MESIPPPIGNPAETLLMIAAERAGLQAIELVAQLSDALVKLGRLRKLLKGIDEFRDSMSRPELEDIELVCNQEKLYESEALLWDMLEKMMESLEPDPEKVDEHFGEGESNNLISHIMTFKATFAERKKEALES